MPLSYDHIQTVHRSKIKIEDDVFNAMVVRTVKGKEMEKAPGAMKAMDDEFNKLSKQSVWDVSSVREYDKVMYSLSAVKRGVSLTLTTLAANGKDDKSSELSSIPATLEASKAVDAFGLMPGNAIGQCDAEQAYIQSKLGGTTTWVSLPKERWPESFNAFRRPACILKLS
eukprot:7063544-Heterocapsa_arctica.AAC.1